MNYYQYPDYMYHYGIKGMKWGVRKRTTTGNSAANTAYSNMRSAKRAYKSANKQYNKDFNKAWNYSSTPRITKKGKAKRDALWTTVEGSAAKSRSTKAAYKSSKKAYKKSLDTKNRRYTKSQREIDSTSGLGKNAERNINRKMNKGQSHTRALVTESAKAGGKSALAAMGISTATLVGIGLTTSEGRASGKKIVDSLVTSAKKRTKVHYM